MEHSEQMIAILGIGTAVPPYRLGQDDASRRLAAALEDQPEAARWARRIFRSCGVDSRFTCEPNLLEPPASCRYVPSTPRQDVPLTAERMEMYRKQSAPLGLEAARKALRDSRRNEAEITHLITVSCTGQFLPGLDAVLIRELDLKPNVNRIPLTFMGCAAGLTAIRLAKQTVQGDPSALVLIVCVELCTLHIQPSGEREALFATAFFGDGASACLVGQTGFDHAVNPVGAAGLTTPRTSGRFFLGAAETVMFPGTADEMVWHVGNHGFQLYLSPRIPELIGRFVPPEIERLLGGGTKPELWAIHPGGRGILDTLQGLYELTDEQILASRSVLRRYGNLSSATLLFVLDEIRQRLEENGGKTEKSGIALAFGPGLSAELMRFAYHPGVSGYQAVGESAARV